MVSVGVDVSKGKSMVCFMRPYGEVLITPYDVQHCEKDLLQLVEQIHRLNDEVRVVMKPTGAYHYSILTFLKQHGIPRLIAEIGDARRFHSGSASVAYAGLYAPPYQSGTFTGTNRHIPKHRSSSLRKTGYEVIRFLKCVKPTKDTVVYDFLLEKEAEEKPPRVAKIAALNKFLRIYYARVKELYR